MEINLTTPALLFPAISLLLLAYTNRFLTLAALIRDLHARYKANPEDVLHGQIANLWYRVRLIKYMQALGVGSILLCTVSMFALLAGSHWRCRCARSWFQWMRSTCGCAIWRVSPANRATRRIAESAVGMFPITGASRQGVEL